MATLPREKEDTFGKGFSKDMKADEAKESLMQKADHLKQDVQDKAEKASRYVRDLADTASTSVSDAANTVKTKVEEKPVQSSLVALGLGFLIGALIPGRKSSNEKINKRAA